MNSIFLKNVPDVISKVLALYHLQLPDGSKTVKQTAWRELTSSDLQAVIQAV
eukprot:CAMPEP_0181289712 /NCGR_PEP_ID=MMETSP1101-20121128/1027_1 /TAXON_ID=46948 /ORGANISM="Rhodomonas abbreviata, Strain Caron Lab Isolate" /LENGTH=51 /DNA_ID=CAMNT_0023393949 /DNA_START=41 /DNA_END=193 /DNA_ORIENTATION=+